MILYLNLLTSLIMATTDTASSPRFTPQDLPYAYDALAPAISEETMHYHHDKHYAGYVDKLNELIVDTPFAGQPLEDIILSADGPVYNNAAQAWNHAFFFGQLSPKPQKEPSGELLEAINRNFGSLDELKVQIGRAAAGLFGSGWVWLAEDPSGRLAVVSEQNAGNPMRHGMKPLLAIDVWEHAYYIDYRNRRADAPKTQRRERQRRQREQKEKRQPFRRHTDIAFSHLSSFTLWPGNGCPSRPNKVKRDFRIMTEKGHGCNPASPFRIRPG